MTTSLNIAVIGAGISGIAAANVLQKQGHRVTIYEKSPKIGGVWAVAYPQVTLQNSFDQYHFSDFPWPFQPDLHPTGEQIMRYLQAAVEKFKLNVRLEHEILSLEEQSAGWLAKIKYQGSTTEQFFDYVVIAVGQYTEGKYAPQFPGQEQFQGQVLTERDIKDMNIFANKTVVVVGYGKSAVDMATMAAEKGAKTHLVFRTARWLIPRYIFGVHMKYALFGRFGSIMMPSWVHPSAAERFLHEKLPFLISGFWSMIANVVRLQHSRALRGKDADAKRRFQAVQPPHAILPDLRSAAALAPTNYFAYLADGKIEPHQAQVTGFTKDAIQLSTGETIQNDLTILSVGSKSPAFPFLPAEYRKLLESEEDGAQLYRHLIHPRIPRMGFAGFNHGFMHVPAAEVGTLWLSALMDGTLTLPSVDEMEASIEYVRQWKRDNIHFEPSRSCAINTRYQQYIDTLLMELGLSPYRKTPNVFAEIFAPYSANDYRNIVTEYQKRYKDQRQPVALKTLPYHV
jgi:dimethylaniline monooxygenase (N-oxide forming)